MSHVPAGIHSHARRRGVALLAILAGVLATLSIVLGTATGPAGASTAGQAGDFVPLPPATRLLDTRSGVGGHLGAIGANQTITVVVAGQNGVPAGSVRAVLLDVTILSPSMRTGLTLWPNGSPKPGISQVSSPAGSGANYSNSVLVAVGSDGKIALSNAAGSTGVGIDIQGYFSSVAAPGHGGYVRVNADRLMDTRTGTGAAKARILPGHSVTLTPQAEQVPTISSTLYLEVSVLGATSGGYLSSYPAGGTDRSSLLGFQPGNVGAGELVRLGTARSAVFVNHGSAPIDLVLDLEGYFTNDQTFGSGFQPLATRIGSYNLVGHGSVPLQISGTAGIPTRGAVVAALNITSYGAAGSVRVVPDLLSANSQDVDNSPAAVPHASLVHVTLHDTGRLTLVNNSAGAVQVTLDTEGWYSDGHSTAVPIATGSATSLLQRSPGGPLDVAWVSDTGQLYHAVAGLNTLDQARTEAVSPNLTNFTGQPGLATTPGGGLLLSVLHANDGRVWTFRETPGTTGWTPVYTRTSGVMAAPPVSANLANGAGYTFGVDADGALWVLRDEAGAGWQYLDNLALVGTPTAVDVPDGIDLVGRTRDGTVLVVKFDGTSLGTPTDLLASGVTSRPAAMINIGPRLTVVVGQPDGTVISKVQNINGSFPDAWTQVGSTAVSGTFTGAPAVGIDFGMSSPFGSDRKFVLMRSAQDGNLYEADETAEASGTWTEWQLVPGQSTPPATDATVTPFAGSSPSYHWVASYLDTDATLHTFHGPAD